MDEPPDTPSRRQFLSRSASAVALAGVASLGSFAGCTGLNPGSDGGEGAENSDDTPASAGTSTPTPDGLRLETLAVGGSPGGSVVVEPPEGPALLDFFATWCAPCKPQMAELRTVREEFPDLHMLSLTREDDPAAVESFWTEYDGTWPVAQDPRLEAFREYDITRIPTLLVLDGAGREVWRHSGLSAAEDVIGNVEEARA